MAKRIFFEAVEDSDEFEEEVADDGSIRGLNQGEGGPSLGVFMAVLTSLDMFAYGSEYREDHNLQRGFDEILGQKSDLDFFKHLRVTRASFQCILTDIEALYGKSPSGSILKLGPRNALYLTLWYLGTPTSYREISELFGVSMSVVHDCVQKIIEVLCLLKDKYIKWPSQQEATEREREFFNLAGFPGCIGAVDGCHINIKAPEKNQADFLDRTMRHSVNLMAVCTADKKFSFVQAGFPGCAHDSRAFKSTTLWHDMERNPELYFPSQNNHIIGDSAFGVHTYLMAPFRDTGSLAAVQLNFNRKLSRTRVVIENAFAFLKGRFRRLKYVDADLPRIPKIIVACCVLHNITLNFVEEEQMLLQHEGIIQIREALDLAVIPNLRENPRGEEKRMALARAVE